MMLYLGFDNLEEIVRHADIAMYEAKNMVRTIFPFIMIN